MGAQTPSAPLKEETLLNADPAHLAYLLGQIGRYESRTPRGHYPAPRVRPQRKPHTFSSEQREAFEFLKMWIHDLSEGFTAAELRKAFRQAALRLHPDQGGSPEEFVSLKSHYETLQTVLPL